MKKGIILSLVLCGILSVSTAACGENKTTENYDVSLAVNINLNGEKEKINPLIYGQFIEHIEDCIYDGIWAEKVLDRKFYYAVDTAGLSPWKSQGNVTSQTQVTLSGGHAVKISAGGGIVQKDLALDERGYDGYFWCNSAGGCTVRITLSAGTNTVSDTVQVQGSSEFNKYHYSFDKGFSASTVSYSLEVTEGEGIFDSLSMMPDDNYKGMRKDTLDALKQLGGTIYRWPGGNFLSGYDWTDGIGAIDRRPSRRNLHYMGVESSFINEEAMIASDIVKLKFLGFYGGIEPNDYGLDEFMAMCEYIGAEPMMMVNTGLGSVQEAAAQVEYCNGSASTPYGAMRAENGHAQSYGITYWGVGNEMFGSWQLGHVSSDKYVTRHNEFAAAMKRADNSIKLIASGCNANYWSEELFKHCGDNMDFIAEHMYGKQDNTDVFAHLNNMRTNINGRIQNHRKLIEKYPQHSDVKIAFTEYAYDKVTNPSRLKDGMGIGVFLNAVINNADVFETCCYSSTVNATQGCIKTWANSVSMEASGYVLKLYRDYMQEYKVRSAVKVSADLQLDISAAVSADGKTLTLSVINPSDKAVALNGSTLNKLKDVTRHTLTGDYYDSYNTPQREEMFTENKTNLSNVVAPPMSVNVFEIRL